MVMRVVLLFLCSTRSVFGACSSTSPDGGWKTGLGGCQNEPGTGCTDDCTIWCIGFCKQDGEANGCTERMLNNKYGNTQGVYDKNDKRDNADDDTKIIEGNWKKFEQRMNEVMDTWFSYVDGALQDIKDAWTKAKPHGNTQGNLLNALNKILDDVIAISEPGIVGSTKSLLNDVCVAIADHHKSRAKTIDTAGSVIDWVSQMRGRTNDDRNILGQVVQDAAAGIQKVAEGLDDEHKDKLSVALYEYNTKIYKKIGAQFDVRNALIKQFFKDHNTQLRQSADDYVQKAGEARETRIWNLKAKDGKYVVQSLFNWHGGCMDPQKYGLDGKRVMEAKYSGTSSGNVCQYEAQGIRCSKDGWCIHAPEGCCGSHSHGTLRCDSRRRNRCGAALDFIDEAVGNSTEIQIL